MPGPLAEAMGGEKTAKSKPSAGPWKKKADELAEQISSKNGTISKLRAAARQVGPTLLHGAEAVGAAGLSGVAKGYLGDRIKVGGVDLRAAAAIGLGALGASQITEGNKMGTHLFAVGEGIAASLASEWGASWGHKMASKGAAATPSSAPPAETDAAGKKLKRDASGAPVKDGSGNFVYEGEIRRIELSAPPARPNARSRELLPQRRTA